MVPKPYILCILLALLAPSIAFAQNTELPDAFEGTDLPHAPGIIPPDDSIGPVGNTGVKYKFDAGFYQRIQTLTDKIPMEGDPGVYDGTRYYNVILVVSRDGTHDQNLDQIAKENKDAIVERLKILGARDIVAAEALSFVTASIPVANIPGFSLHDEVYQIGDGEQLVTLQADGAKRTINAISKKIDNIINMPLDGTGVSVSVIDTGIRNNVAFDDRSITRALCSSGGCGDADRIFITGPDIRVGETSHGTKVAQVLTASSLTEHNGIAPNVRLLDAVLVYESRSTNPKKLPEINTSSLVHAIDWSLKNGADIVNMSVGTGSCGSSNSTTNALITNEAVDKGMIMVTPSGNIGLVNGVANYNSIYTPGCSYNIITVGGIDDRTSDSITMYEKSSRGPVFTTKILKPEIVAPAHNIRTLTYIHTDDFSNISGTSFAAPQVSATMALLLQAEPSFTPIQAKTALLLGASWKGPVPCTSSQYEQNEPNDNCSYAMRPTDINDANDAASLAILNNVGFGILNTVATLEYAVSSSDYIVSDHLDSNTATREYQFKVTDKTKPVKIILSWLAHPHGDILEQEGRTNRIPIANLNFETKDPDGLKVIAASGESSMQTNEFAVFYPPKTGTYTITVSGSGIDKPHKPIQTFALASTNPLTPASSQNSPPVAEQKKILIGPDMKRIVRLHATDPDGDAVSFHVSREPVSGTASTAELITKTVSRVIYTPGSAPVRDTFLVTPHDGTVAGNEVSVNVIPESLPDGSTEVENRKRIDSWNTLHITGGFTHDGYARTFDVGKTVSQIHVGSVNMEGTEAEIRTGQRTYTVAIPESDSRTIDFVSPISIQSVKITATGIDEESVFVNNEGVKMAEDVRVFIGYVESPCAGVSGGSSGGASACAVTANHRSMSRVYQAIPDNTDTQSITSTIRLAPQGKLQDISVSVNIVHSYIGDLKVILTSPGGTQVTLHDKSGRSENRILKTYTLADAGLSALAGAEVNGNWKLSVGDYGSRDTGTFRSWTLELTYNPSPMTPDSVRAHKTLIFEDHFERGLSRWIETGEGDWETSISLSHSVPTLPGHPTRNPVLHSDECRTSCTLTMKDSVDMTQYSGASLAMSRFVDSALDSGEYLKVDLYDGSGWDNIYTWTHGSGDDGRWNNEFYDLEAYLGVSDFKIRFVTKQSSYNEDVQIDGVDIRGTSKSSTPSGSGGSGVTFHPTLNYQKTRITLVFSENIPESFTPSDFEISRGSIMSVRNLDNLDIRHLEVSGIPYNEQVTVKYVGKSLQQDEGLQKGTSSTAQPVSQPYPPLQGRSTILYSDNFDDLESWTLGGADIWSTGGPLLPVPGHQDDNTVIKSVECEGRCIATLKTTLDTAYPMIIEFDRFLSRDMTRSEGLYVEYSTDGGTSWNTLASIIGANKEDGHEWEHESFLADITGSFTLRLVAMSYGSRDHIEVDNLAISSVHPSNLPAVTRASFDFEENLKHLELEEDSNWMRGETSAITSRSQERDRILTASDCDLGCALTLAHPLDTSSPLLVEFYRMIDARIDPGEGIYVEYSTDDGSSWTELGSATADNGKNDGRWGRESLELDIPNNEALLRFVAKSSSPREPVEIDDIVIRPSVHPDDTLGTIRFTAALESESKIVLRSSGFASKTFTPSDFELSNGTVTSVTTASSSILHLGVSDIPYDTSVTVTYTGERHLRGDQAYTALYPGTSTATNEISRPDLPPVLSEISNVTMYHTETTTVRAVSADPEGDAISLILTDPPAFASLRDYGNGTGDITLDPGRSDIGTHTVTVKAATGTHSDNTSFKITVLEPDAEPPVITPPPDITTEATAPLTVVNIGNAAATDDADPSPKISNDAPDGFPVGITIVTWNATDSTGKSATDTQTVTILDTTMPVLSNLPTSATYETNSTSGAVVAFAFPVATDVADPDVTVTSSHKSGDLFPVSNTTVTFTATDDSGNAASHNITITVEYVQPVIQNLVLVQSHDSITASWDPFPSESRYKIRIFPEENRSHRLVLYHFDTSHTFTGLKPGTEYRVTVNISGDDPTLSKKTVATLLSPSGDTGTPNLLIKTVPSVTLTHAQTITIPVTIEGAGSNTASITQLSALKVAKIQDHDNGTATITIDPKATQTGIYKMILGATVGTESAFADITVTVLKSNKAPAVRITGDSPIHSEIHTDYEDAGAVCDDDIDEDKPADADTSKIDTDTPGKYKVKYTCTDSSGKTSTKTRKVLVSDTTAPIITLKGMANVTHYLGKSYADEGAWCKDNFDPTRHIDTHDIIDTGKPGLQTLRYACTDFFGNTALEKIRNVTVIPDTVPPVIAAPQDVTQEATAPLTPVNLGNATVTDDVDPNPRVSNDSPGKFPLGATVVNWTATDRAGNTATAMQTVTITDTTPPALGYTDAYGLAYVDSPEEWRIVIHPPDAQDLVDPDVTTFINREFRDIFPIGLTEFLFSLVDDSGNRATAKYRLYVVLVPLQLPPISDIRMTHGETVTIPLTLPLPHDDNSVSFNVSNGTHALPPLTATPRSNTASYSLVDPPDFATVDHSVPGEFGTITLDPSASDVGTHTLTLNLVTGRHHASTSFEITIVDPTAVPAPDSASGSDTEPPSLSAPSDVTIEATAPKSFVHLGTPVVYDNADPDPAISNNSPDLFPVGKTTVTWNAMDVAGNSASDEQDATVTDTTQPMFHASPLRGNTRYVPVEGGALDFKLAAATDLVDKDVAVTSSPVPGSTFTRGINYVQFTATDDSGNSARSSWPMYVVDSFAPDPIGNVTMTHDETVTVPVSIPVYPRHYTTYTLIDSPGFATVEHGGRGGQALITLDPAESDIGNHTVKVRFGISRYSGTTDFIVSVGQADPSSPGGSRHVGPPDGIILAPAADDYAALLHSPADLAPDLTPPQDIVAKATGPLTRVDTGEATVAGHHDSAPVVANNAPDAFPVGSTDVVWTATDASGNTAVAFQRITILDIASGAALPPPDSVTVVPQDAEQVRAEIPPNATAPAGSQKTDAVPPSVLVSGSDPLTHEVNTAFEDPGAVCDDGTGRVWPADMSELDTGMIGTYNVTYSCAGSVASRTVHIVDTTEPSLTLKGSSVVEHSHGSPYEDAGATCTDNYDPDRHIGTHGVIDVYEPGPQTLRYACTDSSENVARDKTRIVMVLNPGEEPRIIAPPIVPPQNVTLPQETPPQEEAPQTAAPPTVSAPAELPDDTPQNSTLVAPADITLEATGQITPVPLGEAVTLLDLNITNNAPDVFPLGVTVVTWAVIDSYNYTHTANQTVTIQDTTPPEFSYLPQSSTHAAESADGITVGFEIPAASDIVDRDVPVTSSHESGSLFSVGNTTVTFTATDDSGNTATYNMIITVEPESSLPPDDLGQEPAPEVQAPESQVEPEPEEPIEPESSEPEPAQAPTESEELEQ